MGQATAGAYYVPHGSHWPIVGSVALFLLMSGAATLLNGASSMGALKFWLGFAILMVMLFGWFGTVIRESQQGLYNGQVDVSFRMGMVWFIFSEVMFFAAFFGALFYARIFSVPWLGGEGDGFSTNQLLHQGYEAAWPTNGPRNIGGYFETIPAWGIPLLNTLILLTSGLTITLAHWALKVGKRGALIFWMAATILLGCVFLYWQAYEYIHAYRDLGLTLGSGIYGSTFFMLTGFHGLHVTLGTIMLIVILFRCIAGHFTKDNHFAFEAVAWYWHFVDVVWLGLFVFVYVL
jgi:cytochrome c oxidase subunit 3